MDTPKYVELTSAYRNRKVFPLQSEFIVPSGTTQQTQVISPVCNASPILFWHKSFSETKNTNEIDINSFDVTYSTTDTTIIEANTDQWRKVDGYYNGTVLLLSVEFGYVEDGLILYLDARSIDSYNGGSIWYDLSTYGNNGYLINTVFVNRREGFIFNSASNTYVRVFISSLTPVNTLSIETYVYCTTLNLSNILQAIVNKISQYGLFQNGNTPNSFEGVINNVQSMYTQSTNNWYHIVITYDSTQLITYINSLPISTYALVTPINVTDYDLFYGDFSGNILFARLYNRALNQGEVYKNYLNATLEISGIRRRIQSYSYINSNKAELVLYPPPLPDGTYTNVVIERPMYDTTISPRFFIPNGSNTENYYTSYYLQNIDTGEYKKIIGYDGTTHLVTLDSVTNDNWMEYYVWKWIGGSNMENQNVANEPPSRDSPAVWVDYKNRVWLYSGANYSLPGTPARPNDLWRLDDNKYWTLVQPSTGLEQPPNYTPPNANPGGRFQMATCIDLKGNLILFGGRGLYGDLWQYNIDTGLWTWLAGSPGTAVPPNYGVQGVPASTNEPGSRYAPTIWVDKDGLLWLFGGSGHDDIWKWDGQYWTWMYGTQLINQPPNYIGPNATPGGRGLSGNANMNFWFDTGSDTLYIYGGYGLDSVSNLGILEDMWIWKNNTWTFLSGRQLVNQLPVYGIQNILNTANNPGSRVGSACWIDVNGDLWMFGGKDEAVGPYTIYGYGCLWKYDKPSGLWVWVSGINIYTDLPTGVYSGTDAHPGIRSSMSYWKDIYGTFYIYGGFGYSSVGGGTLSDLWKFISDSSNFLIRKDIPINNGLVTKYNNYTITLENTLYTPQYYVNGYVRIIGNRPNAILGYSVLPSPYAEEKRILQFANSVALLEDTFSTSPLGLWYEILPLSYDNLHALSYPYNKEQTILYDVKLIQLRLPIQNLIVGNGGTCLNYPYFYVKIQNYKGGTGGTNTLICSNNPNARDTVFSVDLTNIFNTAGGFVNITGSQIVQRFRINPSFDLLFSIYLPNGELLEFNTPDNLTPTAVSPELQISALFEFKKITE